MTQKFGHMTVLVNDLDETADFSNMSQLTEEILLILSKKLCPVIHSILNLRDFLKKSYSYLIDSIKLF
jgi:hypothetical protein